MTRLLSELGQDHPDTAERLVPFLYAELRALAERQMRGERTSHTLQPTALVHEAFIRLAGENQVRWQNRAHFFAVAAGTMRRILVDHARRQRAVKRSGGRRVTLREAMAVTGPGIDALAVPGTGLDVLALDEALEGLRVVDERAVRVVELRFFAGLEVSETALVLGVSEPTVKRDWRFGKAWLARRLRDVTEAADAE